MVMSEGWLPSLSSLCLAACWMTNCLRTWVRSWLMRRIISWAVRLSTLMAFAPTSNPRAIIFSRNSGIGILNLLASSDKFILHNHRTNIFKNQGLLLFLYHFAKLWGIYVLLTFAKGGIK